MRLFQVLLLLTTLIFKICHLTTSPNLNSTKRRDVSPEDRQSFGTGTIDEDLKTRIANARKKGKTEALPRGR